MGTGHSHDTRAGQRHRGRLWLAFGLLAAHLAGAPHRTFGLYRLEVLAALANAGLLFGVAGFVLVEAVRRFGDRQEVLAGPMLAVAAGGLVANLIAFRLVRPGGGQSLNVRGGH